MTAPRGQTRATDARRDRPLLTAIDLFSGAGGLTLGLQRAGFAVVGAVEIDPLAAETYRLNHPGVHLWEADIRSLDPAAMLDELGLRPGELALAAGCPPCQGFSTLRTLNGHRPSDDPRNDLLDEYVRFVRVLRPKALLMENVPGLARDPRLARFVAELDGLGYPATRGVQVRDASRHGVAQKRRRVVVMAGRGRVIPFPPERPADVTVRDAIGDLPAAGKSGDELHDYPERRGERVAAFITLVPKDGGGRLDVDPTAQLPCHDQFSGFKDVYGRMAWAAPAPTITSGCVNPSKGRFLHPDLDRAITLREAALLQGFPADYRFALRRGKLAAAAMIGNALPPPFVEDHARAIASAVEATT